MFTRRRVLWGLGVISALGLTLALVLPGVAASASPNDGGYGTPYPTATATQPLPTPTVTVTETVTPTPTQPTPTPTVPVVNPFAGCAFSTTFARTFDPVRFRWVLRLIPAIVCHFGGITEVYDLSR